MEENKIRVFFLTFSENQFVEASWKIMMRNLRAISAHCDVAVVAIDEANPCNINETRVDYFNNTRVTTVRRSRTIAELAPLRTFSAYIRGLRHLQAAFMEYRHLKRSRRTVHFIHAYNSHSMGWYAAALSAITGTPYAITEKVAVHFFWNKDPKFKVNARTRFKAILLRLIMRRARLLFSISTWLRDRLIEVGAAGTNCVVVPNAVDISSPPQRNLTCRVQILAICKLWDRVKNVRGIMRVFARLRSKYPEIDLHVVGDGADRAHLEMYARKLGFLNSGIYFHGYVRNDDLGTHFASANFFVLNSFFETFSVATLEAIAHGVPVVVSPCGGPNDIVTPEVGIVAREMTDDSLHEAMEYMINHWKDYSPEKLSEYAARNFGMDVVAARTYKAYLEHVIDK